MKIDLRLTVASFIKVVPFVLATLLSLLFVFAINFYISREYSAIELQIELSMASSDTGQVFFQQDRASRSRTVLSLTSLKGDIVTLFDCITSHL